MELISKRLKAFVSNLVIRIHQKQFLIVLKSLSEIVCGFPPSDKFRLNVV